MITRVSIGIPKDSMALIVEAHGWLTKSGTEMFTVQLVGGKFPPRRYLQCDLKII